MSEKKLRTHPSVAIIVLNWNSYSDTTRCLNSLRNLDYPNYEVYVVDNASIDGSGKQLDEEFERCTLIQSKANRGFAGGNNLGIQHALRDGVDYVVLLNNDTIVENGFLTELVKTAVNQNKAAIVGGVIEHMDSDDIWYAGGKMHTTLVKADRITRQIADEPYNTDHVVGALMLISSKFIESYGMLDENYFFGIEDTEISLRARKNGWHVLVNPNARVQHDVSSTAGVGSPFKQYHATRNRLYFANQYLSIPQRLMFYAFFGTSRLIRAFQWLPNQTEHLHATIDGIMDYLLQRPHKGPDEFGLGPDLTKN